MEKCYCSKIIEQSRPHSEKSPTRPSRWLRQEDPHKKAARSTHFKNAPNLVTPSVLSILWSNKCRCRQQTGTGRGSQGPSRGGANQDGQYFGVWTRT